jgi:hypothetical protein
MVDSFEHQLAALLSTLRQTPDSNVEERRKALHRLIATLQRLPKLARTNHPDYPLALNKTWEWVCREIDQFDIHKSAIANPSLETAFTNWINGYLRYRIRELYPPKSSRISSLDFSPEDSTGNSENNHLQAQVEGMSLNGIEAAIAREDQAEHQRLYAQLWEWVENDPDHVLRNCSPKNCANCSCHLLSQRLLPLNSAASAAQLARELGMNYQTFKTHWRRKCLPILQQKLIELGYHSELK